MGAQSSMNPRCRRAQVSLHAVSGRQNLQMEWRKNQVRSTIRGCVRCGKDEERAEIIQRAVPSKWIAAKIRPVACAAFAATTEVRPGVATALASVQQMP